MIKLTKDLMVRSSSAEFLIFERQKGEKGIEVRFENGDLWLTQKAISDLFDTSKQDVSYHLKNVFNTLELDENSVVKKYLTTASDNKKYNTNYYNLDAVISIGFRVNSEKAIQFRRWSINVLKEFAKKGYIIDKKRMENGIFFGEDYFESLLAEIREIRLSERRFYQKITDIYSSCSVDYDKDSEITKTFFKTVQNKLHYSVTGNTAAEIIYNRVDANKDNMGLTNWASSPDGPIYKYDVDIAKNYLTEKELKNLNRIVTMYLDYAELQTENHNAMTMKDWVEKLDAFLKFNGQEILHNAGSISHKVAQELAYKEYDKFKKKQDELFISDFDKFIEDIKLLETLENNKD